MISGAPNFQLKLAETDADLQAAQRLRYRIFVSELGGAGAEIDHDAQLEKDQFDPYFDHLLLFDRNRSEEDQVVGVYRLMRSDQAAELGQYYSSHEYDLSVLTRSGRRLLELGRSCLHVDYRGGLAMYELWGGLADYVDRHRIEILFGVASFHGTEIDTLAEPLSLLYHKHLAPRDLRVRARSTHFQAMNLLSLDGIDRRAAMVATPSLIKAYLRLGGVVGEGAYVDHAFNTTDVFLVMDSARLNASRRKLYSKRQTGA